MKHTMINKLWLIISVAVISRRYGRCKAAVFGVIDVDLQVGCSNKYDYSSNDPASPIFETTIEKAAAHFIVLNFSHFNLQEDEYVVIRSNEQESVTYSGRQTKVPFLSRTFYTEKVYIEFYSSHPPPEVPEGAPCFGFYISNYHYTATAGDINRNKDGPACRDESYDAKCYENRYPDIFQLSKAVIRLLIHKSSGSIYCTGWLFGCDGHVLTSRTCVETKDDARNTRFEFSAHGSSCRSNCRDRGECFGKIEAYSAELITTSSQYDYSLLKPKSEADLNAKYGFLSMRESGPRVDEQIFFPDHADGGGKRIQIKDSRRTATSIKGLSYSWCSENEVGYSTVTKSGSIGAPVISYSDHTVIALHHCHRVCSSSGISSKDIIADLKSKTSLPNCALDIPRTGMSHEDTTPEKKKPGSSKPKSIKLIENTVDGSILTDASGSASVDFIGFTVPISQDMQFDILSYETANEKTFIDLNEDCDASFIDSVIILYRLDGKTRTFVAENDDVAGKKPIQGNADGSISLRDSYLEMRLKPGKYVLAVGRAPLTWKQALRGEAIASKAADTPKLCSKTSSSYGNYRLTIRSKFKLRIDSPNSYQGNRCGKGSVSKIFAKQCPYHVEPPQVAPPVTLSLDGTIYRSQNTCNSVDHVGFTVGQITSLTIELVSYEYDRVKKHYDVNGDCDGAYIDPVIYVFSADTPLSADNLIAFNDDGREDLSQRASISNKDSYLTLRIYPGNYVIAVGAYPLTSSQAIAKQSFASKQADSTPASCGSPAKYGNYRLHLTSASPSVKIKTQPTSFIGSKCSSKLPILAESICP